MKNLEEQERIRILMSKAIGTFESQMVYNISKKCSEIAFRELNKWINVNEQLPEYMQCCIIQDELGVVTMAQFGGYKNVFISGDQWYNAVYWQPLPNPITNDNA